MPSAKLVMLVLFIICEFLAAVGVQAPRVSLIALGLFFFGLSLVF